MTRHGRSAQLCTRARHAQAAVWREDVNPWPNTPKSFAIRNAWTIDRVNAESPSPTLSIRLLLQWSVPLETTREAVMPNQASQIW